MYHDYSDITDRIAEPPKWWDEHGVPRYGQFSPYGVANIYAQEVALVEIACQWCGQLFEVAFSFPPEIEDTLGKSATLAEAIRSGKINYGDPPDYGNCQSGPSMSCYDLRSSNIGHGGTTKAYGSEIPSRKWTCQIGRSTGKGSRPARPIEASHQGVMPAAVAMKAITVNRIT